MLAKNPIIELYLDIQEEAPQKITPNIFSQKG